MENEFAGDHKELTEQIIACFYLVLRELGTGFLESVYAKSLAIALRKRGLSVEREVDIQVWFQNENVGYFRADLIVNGLILLELKTAEDITKPMEAQLLNYLRATTLETGMIFAFGSKANFRRLTLRNSMKRGLPIPSSGASSRLDAAVVLVKM